MNKKQQRQQKMLRQQEIVNAAKEAGRDLTAEEQTEFDSLQREIERLNGEIEAEEQQQRGMNPPANAPPQNTISPINTILAYSKILLRFCGFLYDIIKSDSPTLFISTPATSFLISSITFIIEKTYRLLLTSGTFANVIALTLAVMCASSHHTEAQSPIDTRAVLTCVFLGKLI